MLLPGATCEIKGLLTTCGATATAQCVYCARPFCERHGEVLDDGAEVCTRKNCVSKKEDLAVHLEYKEIALVRNRQRLCGLDICSESFAMQCRRCKLYFCQSHVRMAQEVVPEGQPATECKHCQERRPIWEKE